MQNCSVYSVIVGSIVQEEKQRGGRDLSKEEQIRLLLDKAAIKATHYDPHGEASAKASILYCR